MKTTILLLPALAAICYGAALPQSIVTGPTLAAPEPTYTVVIPCYPGEKNCVPRTMTIEARQDFVEPTFVFPSMSQSVAFNDGTTQTAVILPRQSIVTGSATMSAPEPTYTWVIPCYSGETGCVPRTITFEARDASPQSLGSISRSASIPPTLPTTTSTSKMSHKTTSTSAKKSSSTKKSSTSSSMKKSSTSSSTKKASTTGLENSTKGYASRSATIYPRQSLVTASRSVDAWPWGPTVTTEIVTVTVTETETATTTTAVPPSSTIKTATVSATSKAMTTPATTPAATSSSGGISRSVGTDEGSTSSGVISSAVAGSTVPVLTERDALPQVTPVLGSPSRSVDEWPWPIHTTSTVTETKTVTETVTKVPPPPTSTSTWAPISTPPTTTWAPTTPPGTSTVPVLTVPINRREKRQVLGSVSRSATFDGSTPTPTTMVTKTKGWWKDE